MPNSHLTSQKIPAIQLGLTNNTDKKVLEDSDAVLVARTWFAESRGKKLRLAHVHEEARELGLIHTPLEKSFHSALIMFVNELIKEELVELTKDGGLYKENIVLVGKQKFTGMDVPHFIINFYLIIFYWLSFLYCLSYCTL